jgi:glycosyltransferase involved in cell wall biosynthesis
MTGSLYFAVPGDIHTVTGGYLYDLNLMKALSGTSLAVRHLAWGDSFPTPSARDAQAAVASLAALDPQDSALVDGLAYGALDTPALREVRAPLFTLVHHPLALEPGLAPDIAARMQMREQANLEIARHIFVTSPHTGDLLVRAYGVAARKITVVRPGFVRPAPVPTAAKATPPLILSVGILAHRKGHDILLKALARITDLDWQADIVGRAHEVGMTATLTALIADLGLAGRVTLSGEIEDAARNDRYRRATLFALATRYEGYGIVFGEAMGYGLPIVSTRTGAVPETVGDAAGLLVAPEDPQAFGDALRHLLVTPAARQACARASLRAAEGLANWDDAAALVHQQIMRLRTRA